MRIRTKKWTKEELEKCEFYIKNPEEHKGKWRELFDNNNNIHLEIGCGKGIFVSQAGLKNNNINYIAIDLIDTMLGLTKRNIELLYKKEVINNVIITRYNAQRIDNILDRNDKIKRIYINFCNPWPKAGHRTRRLTHPNQLEKYKSFLGKDGEIYFKTDDDELFQNSITYFEESEFKISKITYDLQNNSNFWNNIKTEHEEMFIKKGIKIKALIAILKK